MVALESIEFSVEWCALSADEYCLHSFELIASEVWLEVGLVVVQLYLQKRFLGFYLGFVGVAVVESLV